MLHRRSLIWLGWLLGLLGLICLVGGIVYYAEPAHSLPSFFPGHTPGLNGHRDRRGLALVILAVVFWICAAACAFVVFRRRRLGVRQ
jgi:hypothetical protein